MSVSNQRDWGYFDSKNDELENIHPIYILVVLAKIKTYINIHRGERRLPWRRERGESSES